MDSLRVRPIVVNGKLSDRRDQQRDGSQHGQQRHQPEAVRVQPKPMRPHSDPADAAHPADGERAEAADPRPAQRRMQDAESAALDDHLRSALPYQTATVVQLLAARITTPTSPRARRSRRIIVDARSLPLVGGHHLAARSDPGQQIAGRVLAGAHDRLGLPVDRRARRPCTARLPRPEPLAAARPVAWAATATPVAWVTTAPPPALSPGPPPPRPLPGSPPPPFIQK